MASKFKEAMLTSNICLHVKPTKKFKTCQIVMTLITPLEKETASLNAILPSVLRRGIHGFSETIQLDQKLDSMYGANLRADIRKTGELQVLVFAIEIADKSFLPDNENLLEEGLYLLTDMLFNPAKENGLLREDYVAQEKESMIRLIESIIDDKQTYASKRCFEIMCEKEKYGIYKYGTVADVENITAKSLTSHYEKILQSSMIDLFVVGDVEFENTYELIDKYIKIKRPVPVKLDAALPWSDEITSIKRITENMDVNQGKLVIGFRSKTRFADEDYAALIMTNGVLGAFPHSKLFQNVREKSSLAYYAYSNAEAIKGIMVMSAGIDSAMKDKAVEIMLEQLDEVKSGNISDIEMDFTRKALISKIKVVEDYIAGDVDNVLAGLVTGKMRTPEELMDGINKVTKEDIVRVANRIDPDTIYFLCGKDGDEGADDEN